MTNKDLTAPINKPELPEDIPHAVDFQAVVDIIKRLHPHLDCTEIRRQLLEVVGGSDRIAFAPSEA